MHLQWTGTEAFQASKSKSSKFSFYVQLKDKRESKWCLLWEMNRKIKWLQKQVSSWMMLTQIRSSQGIPRSIHLYPVNNNLSRRGFLAGSTVWGVWSAIPPVRKHTPEGLIQSSARDVIALNSVCWKTAKSSALNMKAALVRRSLMNTAQAWQHFFIHALFMFSYLRWTH